MYRQGLRIAVSAMVVQLATPRVVGLSRSEEAAAVELLAELLLEAARDQALVSSGGPALIEGEEEEG